MFAVLQLDHAAEQSESVVIPCPSLPANRLVTVYLHLLYIIFDLSKELCVAERQLSSYWGRAGGRQKRKLAIEITRKR